jgi:hypothetical protein
MMVIQRYLYLFCSMHCEQRKFYRTRTANHAYSQFGVILRHQKPRRSPPNPETSRFPMFVGAVAPVLRALPHQAGPAHERHPPRRSALPADRVSFRRACSSIQVSFSLAMDVKQMRPASPRSRTGGWRTTTGPMPAVTSRSGKCPDAGRPEVVLMFL